AESAKHEIETGLMGNMSGDRDSAPLWMKGPVGCQIISLLGFPGLHLTFPRRLVGNATTKTARHIEAAWGFPGISLGARLWQDMSCEAGAGIVMRGLSLRCL